MHVTYQTLGHNSAVTREMRIGPEKGIITLTPPTHKSKMVVCDE